VGRGMGNGETSGLEDTIARAGGRLSGKESGAGRALFEPSGEALQRDEEVTAAAAAADATPSFGAESGPLSFDRAFGASAGAPNKEEPGLSDNNPSVVVGLQSNFQAQIELLNREKDELQRGLESQQRAIENLTSENMSLTDRFNSEGASSRAMAREIDELKEQVDSLASAAERALEERDAALNGSAASAERTNALASEVIQLEESLLQARSNELKAQKERAMFEEKFSGLQSKFKSSVEERDALMTNAVSLKAAAAAGAANGVHGGEGQQTGQPSNGQHGSGTLAPRVLGPVTPTVVHSQSQMSTLVNRLQETTNYQTMSMVQSIFSLLDDLEQR